MFLVILYNFLSWYTWNYVDCLFRFISRAKISQVAKFSFVPVLQLFYQNFINLAKQIQFWRSWMQNVYKSFITTDKYIIGCVHHAKFCPLSFKIRVLRSNFLQVETIQFYPLWSQIKVFRCIILNDCFFHMNHQNDWK